MSRRSVRRWMPRWARVAVVLWLVGMTAGCGQASVTNPLASTPVASCVASDQDPYVWAPPRLHVVQACIRVTGRVVAKGVSIDGDSIINLHLDPPYQDLLTPGNSVGNEPGNLDVEAVCTLPPVEPIVMALCASDPNPVTGPYPPVGAHVWMEGRYVLDLGHEAHAELHPLYRFGVLSA